MCKYKYFSTASIAQARIVLVASFGQPALSPSPVQDAMSRLETVLQSDEGQNLLEKVSSYIGIMEHLSPAHLSAHLHIRLLKIRHLYGIWSGLIPYRLRLDTLSEYPEP